MKLRKGQQIYKFVKGSINIRDAHIVTDNHNMSLYRLHSSIDILKHHGTPTAFKIENGYITFNCIPDKAYEVKIRYFELKEW